MQLFPLIDIFCVNEANSGNIITIIISHVFHHSNLEYLILPSTLFLLSPSALDEALPFPLFLPHIIHFLISPQIALSP